MHLIVLPAEAAGSPAGTPPGKMASTLLPTLLPPVSRAAAFLLRTPPKPFRYHHSLFRSLLASASSPSTSPTPRALVTMACAAIPTRRDLLMLGIETSCDDTAAAVVRGDGEILSQAIASQICL
uniref:Gcp-like domain-containing protein n=1 Tax=Aegilops tauschii subsp. strangulata TaxID=200361 RepID=A0A453JW96_AEGTS